jgi:hypothetical protein
MKHGLGSWSRVFSMLSLASVVSLLSLALVLGCSSSTSAKCGRSPECPSGKACIDDGSGSGLSCQKICTKQADCPFDSYCNDGVISGQANNWCVQSTTILTQQAGQWGAPCSPGCDAADGFECYGVSPTDPNAFCTMIDYCIQDSDCPGGWWCAVVDVAPNLTTPKRSFGPTHAVCLPRQYCATCQMDHDCSPAADGTQQHCVQDSANNGFCTPQCGSNATCPLDATCQMQWGVCAQVTCKSDGDCQAKAPAEGCFSGVCQAACKKDADCPASNGMPQHCGPAGACVTQACASDDDCPPTSVTFQHCNAGACLPECLTAADCNSGIGDQACVPLSVCVPRAGACVGDNNFCSPCRSDADCSGGYCVNAQYSTERFCSHATLGAVQCPSSGALPAGSCPMLPGGSSAKAYGCTTAADRTLAPADQCIGEVAFGKAQGQVVYVAGCWSAH